MEEPIKIKSVQEYIEKVENLQILYSKDNLNNYFYSCFRDKKLAISILSKIENDNEFNIKFLKLIKLLTDFTIDFKNKNLKINNEDIKKFNLLVCNIFSMTYCKYEKFINELLSKDDELELNLKEFFNKNKVEIFEVNKFLEDNRDFFKDDIVEAIIRNTDYFKKFTTKNIEYFFRGQSNTSHYLTPSIFRGLLDSESNIVNDTLSDRIEEFKDCNTMFEKLVKMQHYGIPTRTLDITGNSLSALYFACEYDHDADGAVFLFTNAKESTAYPDSDKVRILSNLSRVKNFQYCKKRLNGLTIYTNIHNCCVLNFYKYLNTILFGDAQIEVTPELINKINNTIINSNIDFSIVDNDIVFIDKLINKYADKTNELHVFYENVKETIAFLSETFKATTEIKNKLEIVNIQNAKKYITDCIENIQLNDCQFCNRNINCVDKLVNIIREEKPSFENRIIYTDLSKWLLVRGAKNNSRIKIQDGHFIIVPNVEHNRVRPFELSKREFDDITGFEKIMKYENLNDEEKIYYNSDKNIYRYVCCNLLASEPLIHKIIINKESKNDILKQLELMGINRATIYPELMEYGKYIKERYNI